MKTFVLTFGFGLLVILCMLSLAPVNYPPGVAQSGGYLTNVFISNPTITNGTVYGTFTLINDISVGGNLIDTNLTPLTVLNADASSHVVSQANGTGAYTNNGSGIMGWFNSYLVSPVAQLDYSTNTATQAPDFSKGYQMFTTNAAFTFLAPIGVDTTKTKAQTAVVLVTNSTAVAVLMTPPSGCYQQGTWYVTNATAVTFFCYPFGFTNAYALPLF